MSILNVEHLSHGFGDRAIFTDVSFRLLKGEHIGLVGANGEGKSTFMSIITNKLMPDEGKIEWAKNVRVGYLDQHTVLEPGQTIRDVLKNAFSFLFDMEARMNQICEEMADASEDDLIVMMEEMGTIQDLLTMHDFYMIDAKVEEVARAFELDALGLERDVTELSGGQRTRVLLAKLLLEKPDILLLDEPTNYLDEKHIEWLRRYLQEYENAFVLISHDIPFLNSVVNLIYNMENQKLDRYVGDYEHFDKAVVIAVGKIRAGIAVVMHVDEAGNDILIFQINAVLCGHSVQNFRKFSVFHTERAVLKLSIYKEIRVFEQHPHTSGRLAAAMDWPTRRKFSSGSMTRSFCASAGYSSFSTRWHSETIRSPPTPEATRPSTIRFRMS